MPKSTLVERMRKKGAPKSWITEVERLLRTISSLDSIVEEYLGIIDNLARAREELEFQLEREQEEFDEFEAAVLANDPPDPIGD